MVKLEAIESFIQSIDTLGVRREKILQHAGVDLDRRPLSIEDPEAITNYQAEKILVAIYELSDEQDFSFRLGMECKLASLGFAGLACSISDSVGEAMEIICKYLITKAPLITLLRADLEDRSAIYFRLSRSLSPLVYSFFSELFIACSVASIRSLAPDQMEGVRVEFKHGSSLREEHVEAILGCPVKFNQPSARLIIDKKLLARTLPASDSKHKILLTRSLEKEYTQRLNELTYKHRVAALLFAESRKTSQELIAEQLNLSPRTLIRKLQQENTTFIEIYRATMRAKAECLLATTSVNGVAKMLGYSTASNFSHAFKLWTNQTPNEFRKSISS